MLLLVVTACGVDNRFNEKDTAPAVFDDSDAFTLPGDSAPPDTGPPAEVCNGVDDDGDGLVDEDFPDEDGNGRADCMDQSCPSLDLAVTASIPEACGGYTLPPEVTDDPWSAEIKWRFDAPSASPISRTAAVAPAVGNLDDDNGDGFVDDDDIPDIVLSLVGGDGYIVAIDGATGVEKWATPGSYRGSVAIADVTGDGRPDVVAVDLDSQTTALDGADGAEIWTNPRVLDDMTFAVVVVADLQMDGTPDVIVNNVAIDGATGTTEWELPADRLTCPYAVAAVGDIDQADDDQEVLWCGDTYDADGSLLWSSGKRGEFGFWPFLVQADTDPEAEVGWLGADLSLWEADGTEIWTAYYDSDWLQPGPPAVGDFDGDDRSEVAFPTYERLFLYDLDGAVAWYAAIDDQSGLAGVSGFDLDADGALELLLADETTVNIVDGATGTKRWTGTDHGSGTLFEYPTVADVDQDGHAEILYTNSSGTWPALTVLGHTGGGWAPAGPTWHAHDYAMTNINADNSVPTRPTPPWLAQNVYRARGADDGYAQPDLVARITDVCVMDCTYGPALIAVAVGNQGAQDVAAGVSLALYGTDGGVETLLLTTTLPALPAATELDGITLSLDPTTVGDGGFRVAIDDDGAGLGVVVECDEADNEDTWAAFTCP